MNEQDMFVWMMAFVRTGGLFAILPVFSAKGMPVLFRVALTAFLSWTVMATLREPATVPADLITLVLATAHELIIGLLMGLGARLVFYAIEMAGQLISTEMGLSMSTLFDPMSQNSPTPIGLAMYQLGTLLFLLSGAHHYVLAAFLRSFELSPPGLLSFHANAGEVFVRSTGNIFLVAVQIAAPIMAVNFIVTLTFAILGKAAPSMNVFSESFAARILVGLTFLGLTLGVTAQLVLTELRNAPELMLRLIP
ncbi:MAG: flagellar biosynthetic protein FliR [Chthoniobacteraceae bacterium]